MRSSVPTPERCVAAYTADAEYRNTRVVQALHSLLAKQQLGSRKLIEQVFSPFRAVFRLVISITGNAYCVNRKAVVSLHRLTGAELRKRVRLSGQLLFRNRLTGVLELRKRVRP